MSAWSPSDSDEADEDSDGGGAADDDNDSWRALLTALQRCTDIASGYRLVKNLHPRAGRYGNRLRLLALLGGAKPCARGELIIPHSTVKGRESRRGTKRAAAKKTGGKKESLRHPGFPRGPPP